MEPKQISLASVLLFTAAAPIWIFLTVMVAGSPGFVWNDTPVRWIFAPAILLVATLAIHRLLPKCPGRLALAAFLAGITLVIAILAVATFANA